MSVKVNKINVLENNVDLNSIFKLNYNFDILKLIIESLINGQKEIQMQVNTLESNIANMPQHSQQKTSSGYVHPSEDSDLFESEDYEDITNKVIKRIGKIKKRLAYLEENAQLHDKLFLDVQFELKQRKDEIENNAQIVEDMKKNFSVFNSQVTTPRHNEKDKGDNKDNNNEMLMGMFKDLETQIQQKFTFIDDKIKKLEQGITINNGGNNNNNNDRPKEETQTNNKNNNQTTAKKNANNKIEENETQTEHFQNNSNSKLNNSNNSNNNNNNTELINSLQKQIMSVSNDLQNLKLNHNNKLTTFDKTIKDIQSNIQTSFTQIKPTLDKIPSLLTISDFSKFQDNLSTRIENESRDFKLELALQKKALDNFKTQLITFLEDNTTQDEMQGIKRRLEAFMTQLQVMRDTTKKLEDQFTSKPQFDPSKYIDILQFNEFKQVLGKQFNTVNSQIDSVSSIIDDLMSNILKNKATFKDLKHLEDTLMSKLEELKLSSIKQFADKTDISKTIKYLEQQIKQVVDSNTSRSNKNESWLLAKKPIGHLCASCEGYIGDLKDSTSYVPWNKIPMRDNGDKLYRIGTGFSKMLQMVNVENNKEIIDKKTNAENNAFGNISVGIKDDVQGNEVLNNMSPRDDGVINNNNGKHTLNASHSLPQIKKRKTCYTMEYGRDEVVANNNSNLDEGRGDEMEDKNKPKIMKITKKQKEMNGNKG